MNKINNTSVNTGNENLNKLRRVFPQFVKENKIDFDALKKFFKDEEIIVGEEKYGLNWAGKSNAFKLIRTSSVGTLTPQEKESKDWDKTENLFIEGDNLEVLKLLQKHYREKIKMIYIDPPYNTGKDFIYKDNYVENISNYYEKTGQSKNGIKMTTNPESAGRYHSDWLTMMYPRLFLARNLLKEDGVIFISIDDNEVANLRLIMDEIFGEENFLACFVWRKTDNQANIGNIARVKEYVFCYSKSKNISLYKMKLTERAIKEYRYKDEKGTFRRAILLHKTRGRNLFELQTPSGKKLNGPWMVKKEKLQQMINNNEIYWTKGGDEQPYGKIYLHESEGQISNDFLGIEFGTNQQAGLDLEELFEGKRFFDFPKPVSLIQHFITIGSEQDDIILDFFAGSGTTAHAVMELNAEDKGDRKWICVQLPETTDENSEAYKAGYKNIAEIAKERIRRAGKNIDKGDIGFKSLNLSKSNYRQWNLLTDKDDEQKLIKQMKVFLEKPLVDGYDEKSVVYEILLKEGYDLNSKVIQEKNGNLRYWQVVDKNRRLLVTFEKKISKDQVESLKLTDEDVFVCLDSALDDTTKINIGRNLNVKVI